MVIIFNNYSNCTSFGYYSVCPLCLTDMLHLFIYFLTSWHNKMVQVSFVLKKKKSKRKEKKKRKHKRWQEWQRNGNPHALFVGIENGAATVGKQFGISLKRYAALPYNATILLLVTQVKELNSRSPENIYTYSWQRYSQQLKYRHSSAVRLPVNG